MLRDPWHCEGNATGKGSCQTGTMYYGTCLRALLRNTFYMDLQSAAVFPDVLYVAITYFMRYLSRSTGVYGVIGHLSTFTAVCIKLDSASTRRKKKKRRKLKNKAVETRLCPGLARSSQVNLGRLACKLGLNCATWLTE